MSLESLSLIVRKVTLSSTRHHSNGSKHTTAHGYDLTGWQSYSAHFYRHTRDDDETFVYAIRVNPGSTEVVRSKIRFALGGTRETIVYPQHLTHNNFDERTVSVSVFFDPLLVKLTLFG